MPPLGLSDTLDPSTDDGTGGKGSPHTHTFQSRVVLYKYDVGPTVELRDKNHKLLEIPPRKRQFAPPPFFRRKPLINKSVFVSNHLVHDSNSLDLDTFLDATRNGKA